MTITAIDQEFLAAARIGDAARGARLLREGVDINACDPRTGLSALHYSAGARARPFIDLLESAPGLNRLVKDAKGRLPSALAFEIANDRDLGSALAEGEIEQAERQGLDYRTVVTSPART